ncbi:hypothetical protein WJ972_21225 [Achromobacter insuavis]
MAAPGAGARTRGRDGPDVRGGVAGHVSGHARSARVRQYLGRWEPTFELFLHQWDIVLPLALAAAAARRMWRAPRRSA